MCIIGYMPSAVKLPNDDILARCWDINPDGGGFMWIENGEVKVFRTMQKQQWINQLKKIRGEREESPLVYHTRSATHGLVGLSNTHPFSVGKDMAFVHNGHISPCSTSANDERSDTAKFALDIVAPMKHMIFDDGINFLLEEFIGKSKLVFLSVQDGVKIVREDSGVWDKELGCWFSNTGYLAPKVVTSWERKSHSVSSFTGYEEKDCLSCGNKTWSSYTFLLGMGAVPYLMRVNCCYKCREKFFEDLGWTRDMFYAAIRKHDCVYCGKNVFKAEINNMDDVYFYDIESNDHGRVCHACYLDNTSNNKVVESIWNCKSPIHALEVLSVLNSDSFLNLMENK